MCIINLFVAPSKTELFAVNNLCEAFNACIVDAQDKLAAINKYEIC